MNYIKQLNAYNEIKAVNCLSTNAQCLYVNLLSINNKLSWADSFTVSNLVISNLTSMNVKAIERARNELKQKGYITYAKGTGSQAGRYSIIELTTQNVQQNVGDENLSDKTSTQNDLLDKIDTQNDLCSQNVQQSVQQNVQQMSNKMSILNKQETINSVYLSLIKKAHENFEVTNNAQRVYAYNWCKQQPEYAQLDTEHYMKLYNAL